MTRASNVDGENPRMVNRAREWQAFDRLPPAIRRQLAGLAYDYAALDWMAAWRKAQRQGCRVAEFYAAVADMHRRDIAINVRRTYGPTHPEAA